MPMVEVSNGGTELTTGALIATSGSSFYVTKGKYYLVVAWIWNGLQIECDKLTPIGDQTGMSISQQAGLFRAGLFVAHTTGTTSVANYRANLQVIEYSE